MKSRALHLTLGGFALLLAIFVAVPAFAQSHSWKRVGTVDNSSLSGNSVCYWDSTSLVINCSATSPQIVGGNVGIGSTSPAALLDVAGTSRLIGSITTNITGSTQCLHVNSSGVISGTGSECSAGSVTGSGSTGYDAIWTSPTTIGTGLIYESGGQVGIGTATPLSVFNTYGGAISDVLSIGTTSTNGVVLANLAPATSSVAQWSPRLHFMGQGWETNSSASQSVDMIEELQPQTGTANPSGNLTWSSQVNGGGYNPLMTLTTGGNVGIGTAAPASPLTAYYSNSRTTTPVLSLDNGTSAGQTVMDFRTAGNKRAELRSDSAGNLVVEPTAGGWLYLGGFDAVNGTPSGGINFYANNNPAMVLNNSGNVGIGTTSPSYPLSVYTTSNANAELNVWSTGLSAQIDVIRGDSTQNAHVLYGEAANSVWWWEGMQPSSTL